MSEYSERLCVVCGCGDVDLEPHPEFGGALLCRHCWPAHDSGRLDSPPERWREHDERDDRIGELKSEVARLREQVAEEHAAWAGVTEQWKHALGKLDEATEEIATLRLAIGTQMDAQVLSPLSVSPAEPMLICPSCQCAWPGLMPGRDDTVTCSCGRLLGCAMRDR